MQYIMLLILFFIGGCKKHDQTVYHFTCWSGGNVIIDETLVNVHGTYEYPDGTPYNTTMIINATCRTREIGKRVNGEVKYFVEDIKIK